MSDYHPEGVSPFMPDFDGEARSLVPVAVQLGEDMVERLERVADAMASNETVSDPDGSLLHDIETATGFWRMRALDEGESA